MVTWDAGVEAINVRYNFVSSQHTSSILSSATAIRVLTSPALAVPQPYITVFCAAPNVLYKTAKRLWPEILSLSVEIGQILR